MDAEYTFMNPGISAMALGMMLAFNKVQIVHLSLLNPDQIDMILLPSQTFHIPALETKMHHWRPECMIRD